MPSPSVPLAVAPSLWRLNWCILICGEAVHGRALAEALCRQGWTAEWVPADDPAAFGPAAQAAAVLLLVGDSFAELGAQAPAAILQPHPRKWARLGVGAETGSEWERFVGTCMGVVVAGGNAGRCARTAGAQRVLFVPDLLAQGSGADRDRAAGRLAAGIMAEVDAAREAALARLRAELEAWPELRRECAAQFHRPHALETPRFDRPHVREVVQRARERYPEAKLFYLTDTAIVLTEPDVRRLEAAGEAAGVVGPKVFICAFFSDAKLAAALAAVRALPEAIYLTPLVFWPTSRYFHRNDEACAVLRAEASLPQPKFALEDFENLIQALEATRNLDGDYVEIGVFQGRSAHCVLQYLRRVGLRRRAWLLDVYEGFTYEAAKQSSDAFWLGTHTETTEAGVREWMAEFPDARVVKANVITEPLPAEVRRVVVANIDVDLYEAVAAAIQRLAPLMVPGGILILEDQGHTPPLAGAWLATCEFLASPAAADFVPLHMTSGQLFLIRR